ncbi:MAG: tetratricopeptide repeat protein, partial [Frankiales bacterium]|nr:tetratricopeptide repeat protein [Frankiales bacterium]
MVAQARSGYVAYLPRLVRAWPHADAGASFRVVDGSLVSVDISGFTALSERLAAKGKAGAEELILGISGLFEGLIGIAHRYDGDVLKFRGDALLLLFDGDAHAIRACDAASDMQWFIEHAGSSMSSVGEVDLRMSTGVQSGECHFFLCESTHRELLVTGPAASAVVQLEDAAEPGEVLVSAATAASLDPDRIEGERDGAFLFRRATEAVVPVVRASVDSGGGDLSVFVPAGLRRHLAEDVLEPEHRQVCVAFVKWSGTDALFETEGAAGVAAKLKALATTVGAAAERYGVTWLESDVDV